MKPKVILEIDSISTVTGVYFFKQVKKGFVSNAGHVFLVNLIE